MSDRSSRWMAISGFLGLAFFLVANFTDLFTGSSLLAASLQLCVNTFVFIAWGKAFRGSKGRKKCLAFFGIVSPPITAGITIWRVLVPTIFG